MFTFEAILCVLAVVGSVVGTGVWIRRKGREARALVPPVEEPQSRTEYARRLLKHVERKTIAELTEGQAGVLRGRARPIAGIPLLGTSRPGVVAIAVNSRTVSSIGVETSDAWNCVDFELVDDSGVIRVEGARVDVAITLDIAPVKLPYTIVGTMYEGVILPDTEILVLGMISVDSEATDYRDGEQLRVLRATEAFPVAVSNDPDLFERGEKIFTMEDVINNRRR